MFRAMFHRCIQPALSLSVSTQCSEPCFIVVSNQRYPCQYPPSVQSNASSLYPTSVILVSIHLVFRAMFHRCIQPALSLSVSTQCSEPCFIVVSNQRYPCQYPPSVQSHVSSLYPTSVILVSIHPVLFGAMLHRCIQPVLSLSVSTQCSEQCFIVVSNQRYPCQYPPSVVQINVSSLYPTSVILVSIHPVLFGATPHHCIQQALSLSVSTQCSEQCFIVVSTQHCHCQYPPSIVIVSIHPVLFGAMLHHCIHPALSLSVSIQCCLEQCFIVVSTQHCHCQYPPSIVLVSIHPVLFGVTPQRCIQPALSL